MGMPSLFIADTMEEIRARIMELTNGKYRFWTDNTAEIYSDDFHSMSFEIYKSHRV